jgi:hypothetical protein
MYIVVNASTGIVAARFLSKKFAQQWLEDNNFDEKRTIFGTLPHGQGQRGP